MTNKENQLQLDFGGKIALLEAKAAQLERSKNYDDENTDAHFVRAGADNLNTT